MTYKMNEPERNLENLIREFVGKLSKGVTDSSFDLLYNGEPGLALRTLCVYIVEEELTVDSRQLQVIERLSGIWEIDPKSWSGLRKA